MTLSFLLWFLHVFIFLLLRGFLEMVESYTKDSLPMLSKDLYHICRYKYKDKKSQANFPKPYLRNRSLSTSIVT